MPAERRADEVILVPTSNGALSARLLARALTSRGIPAALSSAEQLEADRTGTRASPIVIVDADGEPDQVEATCRCVRQALAQARLVLLLPGADAGRLLRARELADVVVGRAAGLDALISALSAAHRRAAGARRLDLVPRPREDSSRGIASLTRREREVLRLVATGAPNHEVAAHLQISPHTVRTHVQNVLSKLGADSRLAATAIARRAGILSGTADLPTVVHRG